MALKKQTSAGVSAPVEAGISLDKHTGLVRTDLHCHNCDKMFIGELDYDIDGQHVIECPHCGHEHCRKIEKGIITDDRWSSRETNVEVRRTRVWKHSVLQAKTSSTATHIRERFLRHRWLNLGGD
jgi:DNA-directed RNA polymerase subunit RPC12/RpoP